MVKTFKTKERLLSFIQKKYPDKISSIKLISTPFGFLILKEGLSLTDALTKLLPSFPKTPWKEKEYIENISKRF